MYPVLGFMPFLPASPLNISAYSPLNSFGVMLRISSILLVHRYYVRVVCSIVDP